MTAPVMRAALRQDADFLAWVILTASRGHLARGWFDIALNQPEERCLQFLRRLATTEAPSWWHYSRFLVAESEGRAVAALSAFPAGEAYPLSQAAMSEAADALRLPASEQSAIWQRGAYIFLCTIDGHDDCWTLENIATLPSHRGYGVTMALLTRAAEEGAARGFKEAQITSFIGNEPARHAYEKAGYRCIDERCHPDFEAIAGTPGLQRFLRSL
jgi:GNAT superfamily N-acetyltransferase